MADRLYLSLWYPNFRLEALPGALSGVLRQFALVGGKRVAAATAYPINFTQPPAYQRIYVEPARHADRPAGQLRRPRSTDAAGEARSPKPPSSCTTHRPMSSRCAGPLGCRKSRPPPTTGPILAPAADDPHDPSRPGRPAAARSRCAVEAAPACGTRARLRPQLRVAGYEQNGHILVDFGLDTPWVPEADDDEPLDEEAQAHIQQNIEKLLAFTLLVEKNCGISGRLLWTESGEPLAEKLIARLQRVH